MENQIKVAYHAGVIVPSSGTPSTKKEILLTASELKQVRAALEKGKKLVQTRLERTKKSFKRYSTTIEQNAINSALYKTDHCKPVQLYPVAMLEAETEAIIYGLEHIKNNKSKEAQQLISKLSSYIYECEG